MLPLHFITDANSLKGKYGFLKPHLDHTIHMSVLNEIWLAIPTYFPFIKLGSFVIMPNHVHGILIINNENVEMRLITPLPNTEIKQKNGGFAGDKNPMFHSNISRVIRWYKGRCSFECRKINPNFGWQTRFHDHIIRNAKSFDTIQNYIFENPLNWKNDKFYKNDTKN